MGVTTKGKPPVVTADVGAANVTAKGPPSQQRGPLLGAGGMGMVNPDDTNAVQEQCNDPVSAFDGEVMDNEVELTLPGLLNVVWRRTYSSKRALDLLPLGTGGWASSLHPYVKESAAGFDYVSESGDVARLRAVGQGETTLNRGARIELTREDAATLSIYGIPTRLTQRFVLDAKANLYRIQALLDPYGNQLTYEYTAGAKGTALLARVIDTAGRFLRFTHDARDRITRVDVVAAGRSQQYVSYDYHESSGELHRATDALGYSLSYEYDALHRLTKKRLKTGLSFYYAYDDTPEGAGQCVKAWGDGGLHAGEFMREPIDGGRRVTFVGTTEPRVFTFNSQGSLLSDETLDGRVKVTREYDEDQQLLKMTNADGDSYSYERDARGNLVSFTDPAGNVTTWEYERDLRVREIDKRGLESRYVYDHFGALVQVSYPGNQEYRIEYDRYGRPSEVHGLDGRLVKLEYDEQHNLLQQTDARGATWRFRYDALGQVIERVDMDGSTSRLDYDALGRPTRLTFADGSAKSVTYGPGGETVENVDPDGQRTTSEYAGTGYLSRQVLPDGSVWRYTYDLGEKLVRLTNPKGEYHEYAYDSAGRICEERTFDGRRIGYAYSASGAVSRIEYPDGNWRSFTYDKLGNIVLEDSPHGQQVYERDRLGRLLSAAVLEGGREFRVTLHRDDLGRVIREEQGAHAIDKAFDARNRRASREVPGCGRTEYEYDLGDSVVRLTHVTPNGTRESLAIERDAWGLEVAKRSLSGRLEATQVYDSMRRLVEQRVDRLNPGVGPSPLARRVWSYDAAHRMTSSKDSRWGDAHYRYDALGQLCETMLRGLHARFEYHPSGALSRLSGPLGSQPGDVPWKMGEGGKVEQSGTHRYEYDACQRRTAKIDEATGERTEYAWDCRDRLRKASLPDGTVVRYYYDAFGRRVLKEVSTPAEEPLDPPAQRTVVFLWDGDQLAAELDSERGTRGHVHYPGTFVPLLQIEGDRIYVVVADHLGVVRELVGDGSVAWSGTYTPWGKVLDEFVADQQAARGPPGVRTPFRLAGQYYDEETGLCSTRFRYWDADSASWCSPDPLGVRGGVALHGYNGVPTRDTDPFGLLCDAGLQRLACDLHRVGFPDERENGNRTTAVIECEGPDGKKYIVIATSKGQVPNTAKALAQERLQAEYDGRVIFATGRDSDAAVANGLLWDAEKNRPHAEPAGVARADNMAGRPNQPPLTPVRAAASREVCPDCADMLDQRGVDVVTPRQTGARPAAMPGSTP